MHESASTAPRRSEIRPTAWRQWLLRCQLVRCDEPCREFLETILIERYAVLTVKVSRCDGFEIFGQCRGGDSSGSKSTDLPYLFENWLRFFKKEVNRQCIKTYLRTQSKGNISHLEALVTLMLRDFITALWRREGTQRIGGKNMDSTNRQLGVEDERTVGDLLSTLEPDPGQEAELAELKEISADCVQAFYQKLSPDEHLLLGARALGWGPTHPEVLARASVGKSVLYEIEKNIEKKLESYLKQTFSQDLKDDPQMLELLLGYTGQHLLETARRNIFPETADA